MKLHELADRLGCPLRGDGRTIVERIRGLDEAGPGDLSFLANRKYISHLASTGASAVIVSADIETSLPCLISTNPYLTFARASKLLHPEPRPAPGVHPSAQIDPSAILAADVSIGPLVVIGPRVRIGARTVIHPHTVLYADVEIGEDCLIHSGVHVRERGRIGHRVIIQNGVVVGGDGFGFAPDGAGRYEKIPQIGCVVIEDDVEIQALSAIDRASLDETRLGRGTKLDNLVHVAHSVKIGADSILCAQVGIAGSAKLGDHVTLAGQVGVNGHIEVGSGTTATAQTGIASSVPPKSLVSGFPAIENRVWLKAVALFARLPELLKRLRALEERRPDIDTEAQ